MARNGTARELLDTDHPAVRTSRAALPQGYGLDRFFRGLYRSVGVAPRSVYLQELPTLLQLLRAVPVRQQAVVANAHEARRQAAEKDGVQFAMEASGHTSSRYIWRYIKPSDEEREKSIEGLF